MIEEIHQRANKTNEQNTSGTNRIKCSNAGGNSIEHIEKEKNTIKGCEDNEKKINQRQLKMTQEKICQYEAEKLMQSGLKQSGKKAKKKQEVRTKHNVKISCKRFRYVCRIGGNKQIAYNTHQTPYNDLVHYTRMRPAKPCLMDEFPLITE